MPSLGSPARQPRGFLWAPSSLGTGPVSSHKPVPLPSSPLPFGAVGALRNWGRKRGRLFALLVTWQPEFPCKPPALLRRLCQGKTGPGLEEVPLAESRGGLAAGSCSSEPSRSSSPASLGTAALALPFLPFPRGLGWFLTQVFLYFWTGGRFGNQCCHTEEEEGQLGSLGSRLGREG